MGLAQLEKKLISIRRHLHEYPELSEQEFETTKKITNWLKEIGIELRPTKLATGVFADVVSHQPGPIVAIRADIDALPIVEQTGLPYASKIDGVMHACGHDFHTAAAIGAAHLLLQHKSKWKGTVRLIFQPAEELGGGAEKVIRDGQLAGVSAIVGLHNKPDLAVGAIGLKAGPLMASVDRFHITLRGKGSHAALPHNGSDPIVAASHLVSALQTIVSRNVSPLKSVVVSITRIDGGSTWNVIPEEVVLEGTIRTFDTAVRGEVKNRFQTVVRQIAETFQQQPAIRWFPGPPPLVNDERVTAAAIEVATRQGLTVVSPESTMGGEDFAAYLQQVPGAFAFFGTNGIEDWHHPAFTVDDSALLKASTYLYESAIHLIKKYEGEWKK